MGHPRQAHCPRLAVAEWVRGEGESRRTVTLAGDELKLANPNPGGGCLLVPSGATRNRHCPLGKDCYKPGRLVAIGAENPGALARGSTQFDVTIITAPMSEVDRQGPMSAMGCVLRVSPVHTAARNCTRDEGRLFGFGDQVVDPKPA